MLSHVNTIFINSICMVDTEVAKKNPQKDTVGFFFFLPNGQFGNNGHTYTWSKIVKRM